MKLSAAILASTMLGLAAPAGAADMHRGPGWHRHGVHHGHHHAGHHRVSERVVEVVEYREPYLPRDVLYNAPPLPLGRGYHAGYRDVISARY